VQFELVDAMDPAGAARLAQLGRAVLPVLSRGQDSVVAVDLSKIADFTGIELDEREPLPAATLVGKWLRVLASARSSMSQIPPGRFDTPIQPGNDRTVRLVGHHIFRIAESYVESARDGTPATLEHSERKFAAHEFRSGREFVDYANQVIACVSDWWGTGPEAQLSGTLETYFGEQTLHEFLERSVWHSAQHTRQIEAVLTGMGIVPAAPLEEEVLAGLPIPKGI
jgi:hypothetical protein